MSSQAPNTPNERAVRLNKIDRIFALWLDPYAKGFITTHTLEEVISEEYTWLREIEEIIASPTNPLSLAGRVILTRSFWKLLFGHIQQGRSKIQFAASKEACTLINSDWNTVWEVSSETETVTAFKFLDKLVDRGDHIGINGELFITHKWELTIFVSSFQLLSKSLLPLPEKHAWLQDKEAMYRERNLDLISNPETHKRFEFRSQLVREVREFFWEKDFLEVETSTLQAQAWGAMAQVFTTHHNALDHDFVLRIALELELKIACSWGYDRIFEIGKNYRNEGIDPSHLQEFTMLEWYAAYQTIETNMEWTEDLIKRICAKHLNSSKVIIIDKEEKEVAIDFWSEYPRVRFPDLLKEHADIDMFTASDEEVREKARELWGDTIDGVGRANLLDDIYKKTARAQIVQPTFVMDYPEDLKPLARPNGDGTASCFQLVVWGWEIVNAYGELTNPLVQRELMERQSDAKAWGDDEAMEVDEVFLKAMEHWFPPMTWNGMGIDRICAMLTGQPNLKDVVLFPTMKPEGGDRKEQGVRSKYSSGKSQSKNDAPSSLPLTPNPSLPHSREEAQSLLEEYVTDEYQRHHALMVAIAMAWYARKFNENIDLYYVTWLLHDIDYEKHPNTHPTESLWWLEEWGYPQHVIDAVQRHACGHNGHTEEPHARLDYTLMACDEISGIFYAYKQMNPVPYGDMKVKSLKKKIKDKSFAAKIDRGDIEKWVNGLWIEIGEHIENMIGYFKEIT